MDKPNIVLLTIDTLRADVLGCYGNSRQMTPTLDRIAEEGIRFETAVTGGSWTQAAFPVLLTSSYCSMYGGCLGPLSAERPALVEHLRDHGYATAGFSTSPLLSEAYQYDRGFDHFVNLKPIEKDPLLRRIKGCQFLLRSPAVHSVSRWLGNHMRPARLYVSAEKVNQEALRWLNKGKSPFFLWMHYMDIHWPYHLEESLQNPRDIAQAWRDLSHLHSVNWKGARITQAQREHYIRLYEQALQYTDDQVKKLLSELDSLETLANTILVIVSDHGEEFLEHGHWGHVETNLFEEILRIPLIIRLPGEPAGRVINRLVSTIDLMPTLLDLVGCPIPDGVEGSSLVPLWSDAPEERSNHAITISERWRDSSHLVAVRSETHKFIWDSQHPEGSKLFDLRSDPSERHDVRTENPDLVKEFQSILDQHLEKVARTAKDGQIMEPEHDEEIIRRLRDLGYIE